MLPMRSSIGGICCSGMLISELCTKLVQFCRLLCRSGRWPGGLCRRKKIGCKKMRPALGEAGRREPGLGTGRGGNEVSSAIIGCHLKSSEESKTNHDRSLYTVGCRRGVDTALMCKILEPIWTSRPETASRVRGRIERILDWAKVRGYRDGENPAAGEAISIICCRRAPNCAQSFTMRRCPTLKSRRLAWRTKRVKGVR